MSRRLLLFAGAAVAVVVAVVLVVSVGSRGTTEPALRRALAVQTAIEPQPAFFGDLLTARAEVLVDRRRADPDRVDVQPDFAPFEIVGSPERSRTDSSRLTALGYRFTLTCLTAACVPRPAGSSVSLPPLRVRAPARGGGTETAVAAWPRVALEGRVDESAATTAPVPWRLETALPPVSFRAAPGRLEAALALAAAGLAALGLALIGLEVVRLRRLRRERARALSGLARALELARESAVRGPDDRRKALSHLARALVFEANGNGRLALAAAELAWARPEPSPGSVEELVREVERKVTRA